jgi:septal ring factor EnvC (AmiA/AmiB activator)
MSYLKHKPGSIEELMANEATKLNDNAYQDMFKKELDKAGKGIGSMSPKEKKDFFNKIDSKYKAKNEAKVDELTKAQEKLPPALQKAIKDKETKKEDLDNKDQSIVKDVVGALKKATKAHAGQAKDLEKAMKTEADDKADEINDKRTKDSMTKGEKKPQKLHADSGSKLTKVETEPSVDYKN